MQKSSDLWNRIDSFQIGETDAEFGFQHRLARENGWSRAYAARAINEYKKFIYLVAVGEATRTPSEAVDQVWHLHLVYTRSYWDGLCGKVLGRPIHHGPTMGGASEDAKFDAAYRETLDAYRAEFGAPPADIWPPAEVRFRPADWRWVDLQTHSVAPKRRSKGVLAGIAFGAAALLGANAAYGAGEPIEKGDIVAALGLGAAVLFVIAILAAAASGASRRHGGAQQKKEGGCSGVIPVSSCGGGGKGGGKDGGHDGGSGCGAGGCGGGGCGS